MAAAAAADDVTVLSSSPRSQQKKKKKLNNDNGSVSRKKQDNEDQKKKKVKENNVSSSSSVVFPMSRVWRLVRGEAGNTTHDARTTNDAVFLINKASEMFLQRFAQDAHTNAIRDRKKSISYHHLSSVVCNGKRHEFLSDFVPEKVKAEDALKARALVEM